MTRDESIADGMFFIVGVPRSGTTLLQSICNAQSRLHVPPETAFFFRNRPPAEAMQDDRAWTSWQQRFFSSEEWKDQGIDVSMFQARLETTDRSAKAVFLALMEVHADRSDRPRLGEKSPHHLKCVEELSRSFPRSKFVHIIRDPRDVVASQLRMPWINDCYLFRARSWRRLVQSAGHWSEMLGPGRWLDLRYEDVVADPEPHVRAMCEFLGEPFERTMLEFHRRSERGFDEREEDWKGRTLQPIDQQRVQRWKHDLRMRRVRGIEREVGSFMEQHGYEPTGVCDRPSWRLADGAELAGSRLQRMGRSIRKRIV